MGKYNEALICNEHYAAFPEGKTSPCPFCEIEALKADLTDAEDAIADLMELNDRLREVLVNIHNVDDSEWVNNKIEDAIIHKGG